jgi:hypothetical protein
VNQSLKQDILKLLDLIDAKLGQQLTAMPRIKGLMEKITSALRRRP